MEELKVGLSHEFEFLVEESLTAQNFNSGLMPVLATPVLIANMENASYQSVEKHLGAGTTTVGTLVNITHLAATPVGMKVTIKATLIEIDRRRLVFQVEGFDEKEKIGEGIHERFVIDIEKFKEKTYNKL